MELLQDFKSWVSTIRNSRELRRVRIGTAILMLCAIGAGISIVLAFVALAQAFPLGTPPSQAADLPPESAFWLTMLAIFTCGALFSGMLWNTKDKK